MKYTHLLVGFFVFILLIGQKTWAQSPTSQAALEEYLRYLASDELMGRMTGTEGNNQAAQYIADHFQKAGLKTLEGAKDYFQPVYLEKTAPTDEHTLTFNGQGLAHKEDMVVFRGQPLEIEGDVVFAGYGYVNAEENRDDYEGLDVAGKIVVVKMGKAEDTEPRAALGLLRDKRVTASKKGAAALIELYQAPLPWQMLSNYFSRPQYTLSNEEDVNQEQEMVYLWINDSEGTYAEMLDSLGTVGVSLKTQGIQSERIQSQNVIGMIEGTDPVLKNEYVFLTAHYDHVGGGDNTGSGMPSNSEDNIYNGARDNAMGTVAVITAAYDLAKNPPARSVICMAYTGEEIGLLGSAYYAAHPLIPFEQVAFNLNCDGAGYNDKSKVTVIGLERTNAEKLIQQACEAQGLEAIQDPVPEQNLFDRSDNVSFAQLGVPAPTFAPGLTAFDTEIQKYYHRVEDEAESLDFEYVHKYAKAFTQAAELIANKKEKLRWVAGDKYESAYQELHPDE